MDRCIGCDGEPGSGFTLDKEDKGVASVCIYSDSKTLALSLVAVTAAAASDRSQIPLPTMRSRRICFVVQPSSRRCEMTTAQKKMFWGCVTAGSLIGWLWAASSHCASLWSRSCLQRGCSDWAASIPQAACGGKSLCALNDSPH